MKLFEKWKINFAFAIYSDFENSLLIYNRMTIYILFLFHIISGEANYFFFQNNFTTQFSNSFTNNVYVLALN